MRSSSAPALPTRGTISPPAAALRSRVLAMLQRPSTTQAPAQAFSEFGYGFNASPVALESFTNLAYVNLRTDSFIETGGAAALTSPSSVIDTAFTTLGLRAANTVMFGTMATTMKGSLGWRHAFDDTVPVATFAFAGGNAFNIAGVPIARDAAVIDVGLDFHLSSNAMLGLSYGGQFGSQVTDQTVRANFSAKF